MNPYDGTKNYFPLGNPVKLAYTANLMIMWDGGSDMVDVPGQQCGTFDGFVQRMDHYWQGLQGTGLHFPNPDSSWYGTYAYSVPVGISYDISITGNDGSLVTGSLTPSVLAIENHDYSLSQFGFNNNTNGGNGGPGDCTCDMRFRHGTQSHPQANFLFGDGHVESRFLGTVLVRDICD